MSVLSKMALCLVELTQLCLPHFKQSHASVYLQLLTDSKIGRIKIKSLLAQSHSLRTCGPLPPSEGKVAR